MTETVLFDFADLPRVGLESIETLIGTKIKRNYRQAEPANIKPSLMWDPATMASVICIRWGDDDLAALLDRLQSAHPVQRVNVVLSEGKRLWLAHSSFPALLPHRQAPWHGDITAWLDRRTHPRLLVPYRGAVRTCVKPVPRYHLLLGAGRSLLNA